MFTSISWDQFLSTVALVVGAYYIISFLLLFSNEIVNIFKQRVQRVTTPNVSSDESELNGSDDLMGRTHQQVLRSEDVSRGETLPTEEIHFAPIQEIEEPIDIITLKDEEEKIVETLIEEIETLIGIVANSSKEESAPLFQSLVSRHSQIPLHRQDEISALIYKTCKDECAFQFEPDEIRSWWLMAENNNQ